MNKEKNVDDFETMMLKRRIIKLILGAIIFAIALTLLFNVLDEVGNGISESSDEIEKERISLVAAKLEINEEDIIIKDNLFTSYDLLFTSKGNYKVEFETKDGKTVIKSLVKDNE